MRKIVNTLLICIMIFMNFSIVFAGIEEVRGEDISPWYITTNNVDSTLMINGNTANYFVKLRANHSGSISHIKAILNLVNSRGTVINSTSGTLYGNNLIFKQVDTKVLSVNGTYHAEYVLKAYKDGRLVETIKGSSTRVAY